MRSVWTPLACYLAITIVVPWLNGAGDEPMFAHHVTVVATLACGLVAAGAGTCALWKRARGR